jgi:beta-lactamase superfamily II metal-dependent hydrolase
MAKQPIKVRMYNVGFGDSFLLLFPGPDRPRRVLVDCGVHFLGPGPNKMKDVVGRLIADTTDTDGRARIDVVVATHRHQDHVSGFDDPRWQAVEVGEVWMPWTEHPTDAEARRIRETQSKRSLALGLALEWLGADASVAGLAKNSLTNAEAMQTLHKGFTGVKRRRFLPWPKSEPQCSFETELLPGVEIHVLGPTFDPDVIRDMDPEKNESYLQFRMAREEARQDRIRPFREDWSMTASEYRRRFPRLALPEALLKTIGDIGEGSELELVTQLEKAVNGTSLMLMFEWGKAHLLFSGDAQWGTWKAAMEDERSAEILGRTTFYKVGHHASHNATPRRFVESILPKDFQALVSTRRVKIWPDIPRKPLLEALRNRSTQVVRSDRADVPDPSAVTRTKWYVETRVRA